MAQIYQGAQGRQLYDSGGQTFDARTGAVAASAPNTSIRNLQVDNQNPGAMLNLTNAGANNVAGSVPSGNSDQFASIINLLKQYQQGGQTSLNQAQSGQIQADISTPQSLIGASPGQQDLARNAATNAFEPTIGGARSAIAEAGNVIKDYQQQQQTLSTHAGAVAKSIYENTDMAGLASLDPKFIAKTETDAGLPKGFIKATIEAKQRAAVSKATPSPNTVNTDITGPEDKRFKIAQDLAYGKLSFQQFRTLYAYSRQTGDKVAIYNKASELNPNFNPSAFELGLKFAGDAQSRRQIAAADNVLAGVGALIEASDAAVRSGVPLLNKAILASGYTLGGVHYATFSAAQKAFADEVSGALGFGTASDMKLALGIDLADKNLSPTAFRDVIQNTVVPFVERKRHSILNQFGAYGGTVSNFSGGQQSQTKNNDPLGIR